MIGKLLGYPQVQTTARYIHLARESVKAPTIWVAESIAADMRSPVRLRRLNDVRHTRAGRADQPSSGQRCGAQGDVC